jgi:hypothetical protein
MADLKLKKKQTNKTIKNAKTKLCSRDEEWGGGGGGHINLPLFIHPFVRPDIDTWFFRLSPPTVLELQL